MQFLKFVTALAVVLALNCAAFIANSFADGATGTTLVRRGGSPSATSRRPTGTTTSTSSVTTTTLGQGNPAIVFNCPQVEGTGFNFSRNCQAGETVSTCRIRAEQITRLQLLDESSALPTISSTECILSNRFIGRCVLVGRPAIKTKSLYDETNYSVYGEMYYLGSYRCN